MSAQIDAIETLLTRMVHSWRVPGLDRLAASQATIGECVGLCPQRGQYTRPSYHVIDTYQLTGAQSQRQCTYNMNTMVSTEADGLLTYKQVARRFGISRRTLERLISSGEFPRPLKLNGASRFTEDDVVAFMQRLQDRRAAS